MQAQSQRLVLSTLGDQARSQRLPHSDLHVVFRKIVPDERESHITLFLFSPLLSFPTTWSAFSSPLRAFQHFLPKPLLCCCTPATFLPEICNESNHPTLTPLSFSVRQPQTRLHSFLLHLFEHFLRRLSTDSSLFPFKRAEMSTKKTQNLRAAKSLYPHSGRPAAQCVQIAGQLRPWENGRDTLERLRDTSFELKTPLVLEVPALHPQNLPRKI